MLRDVQWGELDVLVVDMPPGTGDAQLTLAQRVALAGAVIVSTPQDIALIDARKGLNMFRKVAVPVLGIVENMSYFLCPNCGERSEIFGHGGAREEAEKLGVPFLGEVPLHLDIRTTSDSGHPIVVAKPDSPHTQVYKNIAGRVWKQLSANQRGARKAPTHRGARSRSLGELRRACGERVALRACHFPIMPCTPIIEPATSSRARKRRSSTQPGSWMLSARSRRKPNWL